MSEEFQGTAKLQLNFVSCPTFHFLGLTDNKLVRVSLRLANRHSLAGYWKFNTSLLEIRDFRNWRESLIKRVLVGRLPGIGGGHLSNIGLEISPPKYGRQLNLDRTRKAKSREDRLFRAVVVGTP